MPARRGERMIRKAFVLYVDPRKIDEYRRRHNPIWPELECVLKEHGARNYSIFHEPGSDRLFGYVEIEDEARWAAVAQTDACQRWWKHMSEIMPSNPDRSPLSKNLNE